MSETLADYFKRHFWYDKETGELYWKPRPEPEHAGFNKRWANKPALTATDRAGFRHGVLFRQQFFAHRVIWTMVYGDWPRGNIIHRNGNRSDNRISNLEMTPRWAHLYRPSDAEAFAN